jgi:anthranilate synthase
MPDPEMVVLACRGGIRVTRTRSQASPGELDDLIVRLDQRLGGILTSGVDYPGRYSRWDIGYEDPLLIVEARGRELEVTAPGARGGPLLDPIESWWRATPGLAIRRRANRVSASASEPAPTLFEEDRSRRSSAFTALRALLEFFQLQGDSHLGLYGAFAYDLMFQFEPIQQRHPRPAWHRDLVLHLPDRILVGDRARGEFSWWDYEFSCGDPSTAIPAREAVLGPAGAAAAVPPSRGSGQYAALVDSAREYFARGDLYEVVPSQPFYSRCDSPTAFFNTLRRQNPAPYGFCFNLGAEHLVGASPEMFVRVEGSRVETCPISGTRPRGADAIGDAAQIRDLLNSAKDEAELTMCTDVDRNDKSRVCLPGSVRVIGRRQIELYSRLIHTVDHVEGTLRPDRDALDAFLTHMWAVTVTGAPKKRATQFIEDYEEAPRQWYGGAVGVIHLDGSLNTGLTIRTAEIRDRVALVRAGATLLYDSDPMAEELETELKGSALLVALRATRDPAPVLRGPDRRPALAAPRVLVVDHEDSFTLNLADYFRQGGAAVTTVRWGFRLELLEELGPALVVLSPGPGRPGDFRIPELLRSLYHRGLPVFGVCLGMQGMVEEAGGVLHQLPHPRHGRATVIQVAEGALFPADGAGVKVGRYHSLYALAAEVPGSLFVSAVAEDGVVMAVEHRDQRAWGVQFHPESILTLEDGAGMPLVQRVLALVAGEGAPTAPGERRAGADQGHLE